MVRDGMVWLITGCSKGLGREIAKAVLARGDCLVATARDVRSLEALVEAGGERVLPLRVDVTVQTEVDAAVATALGRFGRLDVLVNNAGYGYFGAIEASPLADIRELFEANVFGVVAMTKAVLPGMRAQRAGLIVNISSIGGLVAYPGVGYYNATKFAVEAISEALSKEVLPLGIRVLIVEPGPHRTDWAGPSAKVSAVEIADYDTTVGATIRDNLAGSGNEAGDPVRAAAAIVAAATAPEPPLRLLLGRWALEAARAKLDDLRRDADAWESTTLGTDYDAD